MKELQAVPLMRKVVKDVNIITCKKKHDEIFFMMRINVIGKY